MASAQKLLAALQIMRAELIAYTESKREIGYRRQLSYSATQVD